MKKMKFLTLLIAVLAVTHLRAQQVSTADMVALLNKVPPPASQLNCALKNASAQPYQTWLEKIEKAGEENQRYQMAFYQKNPMGVQPASKPASRVSAEQQSAMNAATSEFTQKMLSDPAFAQQFAAMSEQEQQAYLTKMLADKGIRPATGAPNVETAPVPGTDVEWAEMCTTYTQSATNLDRWQTQTAIQQRYEQKHQEVRDWEQQAIDRLPMFSYGEYGHDHDPEQVKAVRKQASEKHLALANAMLNELTPLCMAYRKDAQKRMAALTDAFKKVGHGEKYNFGVHYPTVSGAQSMMFQEVYNLLKNEISLMESAAQWCGE